MKELIMLILMLFRQWTLASLQASGHYGFEWSNSTKL